jgi:hypothetical protein
MAFTVEHHHGEVSRTFSLTSATHYVSVTPRRQVGSLSVCS